MSSATLQHAVPVPTWFGIGGAAAMLAQPDSPQQLAALLAEHPDAPILGEGANLLVDDCGVEGLVIRLDAFAFTHAALDERTGRVHAGAGVDLRRLITLCVRAGLGGLERLSGIPASMGGAVVMNAGGAHGELSEFVTRVHAIDRAGNEVRLERDDIDFGYRRSGLGGLVITAVDLELMPGCDPGALRGTMKSIMAAKGASQPMGAQSAGCVFRNPTLASDIAELGLPAGVRASAGMLIDRAGCKGLRVGDAVVSDRHANFITPGPEARAQHVLELMELVSERVAERFGVTLEREVVVWPHDLYGMSAR